MKFLTSAAWSLALVLAALLAAPAAVAQLTAVGNQFWTELSPGIDGEPDALQEMGGTVSTGDFNNDGFADLVIGIVGDNVAFTDAMQMPMQAVSGSVRVLYGSQTGLTSANSQSWQRTAPVDDEAFGHAHTSGDFNKDGFADLAISAFSGGPNGGGEVSVLYGSAAGLTATASQVFNQDSPGVLGASEAFDVFGGALVSGDFNGDGYADLAIGIPGETTAEVEVSGAVAVLYGGAAGLSASGNQFFTREEPQANGYFGEALAAGDFNGDGADDLVVGESGAPLQGKANSGAIHVLVGSSPNGLTPPQTVPAVIPESMTGYSLAVGDFDNNGFKDLVIGAPRAPNDLEDRTVFGLAILFRGSSNGLGAIEPTTFGVESSGPGDFTRSLAVGDFNYDGFDDLAGSAPRDHESTDDGAVRFSGAVIVFGGNAQGDLGGSADFQVWIQGNFGMLDQAETGDRLGGGQDFELARTTLAAADFNGDGLDDLAAGVPFEDFEDPDVGAIVNTGGVHVLYGTREIPDVRNGWLEDLNAIRNQLNSIPVPQ